MLPEEFLRPGADHALLQQHLLVAIGEEIRQLVAGGQQIDLGVRVGILQIDHFKFHVVVLVYEVEDGGLFPQRAGGIGRYGIGVFRFLRQRDGGQQGAQHQRRQQQGQGSFHGLSSFKILMSL